ncbi:hypothetical protein NMY22_g5193 [Coprinellus aureogranulatus]|nr:hypothetical protein NMY22_g5193 [Coprinellus aureogranulatus]
MLHREIIRTVSKNNMRDKNDGTALDVAIGSTHAVRGECDIGPVPTPVAQRALSSFTPSAFEHAQQQRWADLVTSSRKDRDKRSSCPALASFDLHLHLESHVCLNSHNIDPDLCSPLPIPCKAQATSSNRAMTPRPALLCSHHSVLKGPSPARRGVGPVTVNHCEEDKCANGGWLTVFSLGYAKSLERVAVDDVMGGRESRRRQDSSIAYWHKPCTVKEFVFLPVFANGGTLSQSDTIWCPEESVFDAVMSVEGICVTRLCLLGHKDAIDASATSAEVGEESTRSVRADPSSDGTAPERHKTAPSNPPLIPPTHPLSILPRIHVERARPADAPSELGYGA